MPSFDIVSETNMQEVDNAVNQALKEVQSRYDFKGTKFEITLDKTKSEIKLMADDDSRMTAIADILNSKFLKRGLELSALEYQKINNAGGAMKTQTVVIKQGLETEQAKKIVKLIKDSKLKVDAAIQDKQVRVTGKKIDDLQEVIALLKEKRGELKVPLQFNNMRS